MNHYIPGKSVSIVYRDSRYREHEEGIGLARTNHDYFSCIKQTKLKTEIGLDNYEKLFETIKPLHLSNEDGIPMHAVENGFYYIKCIKKIEKEFPSDDFDVNTVAKHFRLSEDDAQSLIDRVESKEDVIDFVESQKPRWKLEAENAYSVILEINESLKNNSLVVQVEPQENKQKPKTRKRKF